MFNSQNPGDAAKLSIGALGGDFQLSRNVRLYEWASDSDIVLVHFGCVYGIQKIRDYFNRPVFLTNGYRTEAHNRRVGGRPQSRHLFGMAGDIAIHDVDPSDVASYAESIGFGGVGRYRTFTHVDVWGQNRRWDFSTPVSETP